MWDFSVIKDLLMNPVYTGAIASQKKDYRFKIGTIGEKKPEDWIVVEVSFHTDNVTTHSHVPILKVYANTGSFQYSTPFIHLR